MLYVYDILAQVDTVKVLFLFFPPIPTLTPRWALGVGRRGGSSPSALFVEGLAQEA